MPSFETPAPISLQIDLPVGDAWVKASDRTDTVVDVRPSNPSSKSDISAAEQTRVEYADGRLLVKAPKSWRRYSPFSAGSSVDIVIELPSGSHVQGDGSWTTFRAEGRLGECRFDTAGGIRLGQTGPLDVDTSAGDVTVDRVVGTANVTNGSGQVRIGEIDGPAVIKNSSGSCWIGEATGDVRVNTASGSFTVDRALADVAARTAYGSIWVGEVVRPSVLTGHVLGSFIQSIFSLAVVVAVGLLVGFRPNANAAEWVAAFGVLAMITFAIIWLAVAFGLVSKSVETASNLPMPLILLPFLGSGFVPTDSMPAAIKWFAEYQPFTPVMETVRVLLLGTAIGNNAILAVAWSVVIALGGYLWSKKPYNRDPSR